MRGDFGDPRIDTDYTLCVFDRSDDSPRLRLSGRALSGSGWRATRKGFRYRARHGLRQLVLAAGGSGRAQVAARAVGPFIGGAFLPLSPRVTVQLQATSGTCWEADYSVASRNDGVSGSRREGIDAREPRMAP